MMDQTAAKWFKSSRSHGGKECVEAAHLDGGQVGVRDSNNPGGPALDFAPGEWDTFLTGVKSGAFDR